MKRMLFGMVVIATLGARIGSPGASGVITIKTLSADPARVTGGDVLVEITDQSIGERTRTSGPSPVTANGRDVTAAFKPTKQANTYVGLITGLVNGRNTIASGSARLEMTNYPITGPVLSGPWQQLFICQTDTFKLPDGTTLGKPLDANCSAKTVVQYVYKSTAGGPLKPMHDVTTLPADVTRTTISTGATVNFIVRVETGTMNRGIYQNAILHDPASDPPPTPFAPPKGWNHRLIANHGVGCPAGWYIQGGAMGVNILESPRLAEGYAIFINTLNHPSNSCNAILAGETTMMGKEHFIETFGVPFYTISTGASGGAYTSLQIADTFPGLFDGISIGATFPDALSIALAGMDAHLLAHHFAQSGATGGDAVFTDAQKIAITGYQGIKAFVDAANQAQRTDPVPNRADDVEGYQSARWNAIVPTALRYDPRTNPNGARPTVFDAARNIYGRDPRTGFGLRPFDNVGVQYGLNALNAGAITVAQFLDLNQRIGGLDQDSNYVASRSVGDSGAIERTYQSGLLLSGAGGLASIPIFDNATSNEAGGYHYGWFHFALRERLRQANGNADNMVMWRSTSAPAAQALFDSWMTAYKSDTSSDPQRVKVLRTKPKNGVNGCYDKSAPPQFIADDLPFTSQPVSRCSELYPVYSNVRKEAGGPLAANVLKCELRPIDVKDYQAAFTADETARLKTTFRGGVCDWSKPGVNQTRVVTWPSFGPSPKNPMPARAPSAPRTR